MVSLLNLTLIVLPSTIAAPSKRPELPSVELSCATVVGSSAAGIDTFNSIPYAQPPIGQLRLKPPQPNSSNLGTLVLPPQARACPQFSFQVNSTNPLFDSIGSLGDSPFGQTVSNAGEDCLTVSVQRPSTATKDSKLPVLFWMFGGGFEFGST